MNPVAQLIRLIHPLLSLLMDDILRLIDIFDLPLQPPDPHYYIVHRMVYLLVLLLPLPLLLPVLLRELTQLTVRILLLVDQRVVLVYLL